MMQEVPKVFGHGSTKQPHDRCCMLLQVWPGTGGG
jgi:hypothetical protein